METTMNENERLDALWIKFKEHVCAARGEGREGNIRKTAPNAAYDNSADYSIGQPRMGNVVFLRTSNGAGWGGVITVEQPACLQLAADALAAYMDIEDAKQ